MKNIICFFALSFAINFFGNAQLNNYKYMVVPKQFDAFKEMNQYQTSTLVKYLFTNNGYTTIYDDQLPEDLLNNGCLALKANLDDRSSLFATKVAIVLKDCNGVIVYTTQEGRSKIKEYKSAYAEAIRQAFKSFELLNYQYEPKEKEIEKPITVSFKNDVKSLNTEPIKSVSKTNQNKIAEATKEIQKNKPVVSEEQVKEVAMEKVVSSSVNTTSEILYAQPIEGGFQLVDSAPKIQYRLTETSVENVFLASHEDKNGVVLKKKDKWFFEYSDNGEKVLKELNIKF
ncbi:hypothetical protein ACFSQJ_19270 [Croceitalea marina]|uniref:TPM domain-containing protein n=1 Tax=Croceitalea marina TaxID=1775166 RepID=A0ABW5N0M9_9FLAO